MPLQEEKREEEEEEEEEEASSTHAHTHRHHAVSQEAELHNGLAECRKPELRAGAKLLVEIKTPTVTISKHENPKKMPETELQKFKKWVGMMEKLANAICFRT